MASRLNEDLMKTSLDLPEGEIKIEGKANPVYADAINVHQKKKKETEKILKDKKPELKKPFLGTKGETTVMPRTKEMKKLKLSESAFKSVREAAEVAEMEVAETPRTLTRKDWELVDKRNNKDMWSDIYNELVGMKGIEAPHRRLKTNDRYKASWGDNPDESEAIRVGVSRDGGIVVKSEEMSTLDFAKEVAETYGVEWRVKEHTSRYADSRYELIIYPFNKVSESITECKAFGRKANKKDLKESANGEIYGKVAKYFEYGAPGETLDTVCDIVDRAVSNIDEGYDIDEAVFDALDNGLIYHKDNWAIKHYYEDSELLDGTYESLYHDVYSIVSDLTEKALGESVEDEDEVVYLHKQSKDKYTMAPTNDGRVRLYKHADDSGKSDITISKDEFERDYKKIDETFNKRSRRGRK